MLDVCLLGTAGMMPLTKQMAYGTFTENITAAIYLLTAVRERRLR